MKNTDIKGVKYNNNEITALYKGGVLVYQKKSPISYSLAGEYSEPGEYAYRYNYTDEYIPIELDDDLTFEQNVPEDYNSASAMFMSHDKLIKITKFPSVHLINASGVFKGCSSLAEVNLSGIDVTGTWSLTSFFEGCTSLTQIDLSNFNTSNIETLSSMFRSCSNLVSLDLSSFDTSKVKNFSMIFFACVRLESLKVNFDMSSDTKTELMFATCNALSTVIGTISNLKVSLDLQWSPLTNSTAMVFVNGLSDVEDTQIIKFSKSTFDTLTEEQIALATSRGWSVVSA